MKLILEDISSKICALACTFMQLVSYCSIESSGIII